VIQRGDEQRLGPRAERKRHWRKARKTSGLALVSEQRPHFDRHLGTCRWRPEERPAAPATLFGYAVFRGPSLLPLPVVARAHGQGSRVASVDRAPSVRSMDGARFRTWPGRTIRRSRPPRPRSLDDRHCPIDQTHLRPALCTYRRAKPRGCRRTHVAISSGFFKQLAAKSEGEEKSHCRREPTWPSKLLKQRIEGLAERVGFELCQGLWIL